MFLKCLDISTSHLKEETLNSLSENKMPYSYGYKEGVFISVPDKNIVLAEEYDFPIDLGILLKYAWESDVSLIRLDSDGEVIKNLPVYKWNESSRNEELAKWIANCICSKCDEKRRRDIEKDITNSLNKEYIESIKLVLERLCEEIEELKR